MIEIAGTSFERDQLCAPTLVYDFKSAPISDFIDQSGYNADDDVVEGVTLLHDEVRDTISYSVFNVPLDTNLSATEVVLERTGFCLHKSILFVAVCRRIGVPAVLCSDVVTNHVSDDLMRTLVGGDRFLHWYTRVYIDGKWVKAAPIFNSLLCNLYGIDVVDFNVDADDIRQEDQGGKRMQYDGNEKIYIDPSMDELLSEIQDHHPLMVTSRGRTPSTYQLQSSRQSNEGGSQNVE